MEKKKTIYDKVYRQKKREQIIKKHFQPIKEGVKKLDKIISQIKN